MSATEILMSLLGLQQAHETHRLALLQSYEVTPKCELSDLQ